MTARPVPIPTIGAFAAARGRHCTERGPFFGLIDILENGEATWLLSDGSGRFIQLRACEPVPHLVFIIEKRRTVQQIIIEILSASLQRLVRGVLGRTDVPGSLLQLDVFELVAHYGQLKTQLDISQKENSNPCDGVELDLLLNGCLLDQSLYHGAPNPLNQAPRVQGGHAYLQDMLHEKLMRGLDELDDCFQLGQLTNDVAALEVSVFNQGFEQLAYAGDLYALQDHVEPAVRSGEVEVQHDSVFLANVLARGHSVVHQYLIDLSQRTLSSNFPGPKSEQGDISTDPMYTAIKQGQFQDVRVFVINRHSFAGFISDDQDWPALLHVTPLVAAIVWERMDILQLLLDVGPPYLDGWSHAINWAAGYNHGEMLAMMHDYEKHHMGCVDHSAFTHTPYYSNAATNSFVTSSQRDHVSRTTSGDPHRSVSEIANRIAGLGWEESARRCDHSSVLSSDASTPTPAPSSWTADTMRSSSQGSAFPAYHIIQPSSAQSYRMRIGRDLVSKLESYCDHLKSALAASDCDTSMLTAAFSSAKSVWQAGLESVRRLLCNQAPVNMTEVVQLLLVANTLGSSASETTHTGRGDRDRWRTAVSSHEQSAFDELVQMAFGDCTSSDCTQPSDINELWRIQELAQNMVSLNLHDGRKSDISALRGLRLPFVYGCHHLWQRNEDYHPGRRGRTTCSSSITDASAQVGLGSWTDWDVNRGLSSEEEEFDLFDYIKAEAVQEEQKQPQSSPQGQKPKEDGSWKSIAPRVVLLLGSLEFSMILHAIERLQMPNDSRLPSPNANGERIPPGIARSSGMLARLEQYCSVALPSACPPTRDSMPGHPVDGSYVSLIPTMKAWIHSGISSASKLSQSLDPYFLQHGMEPRGLSNEDMVAASSLSSSVPSTRHSKALDRLRCQSLGCPKTFSNVSNRNKHMREGCAFREHPGYRCRNQGCTKTLTTKWYRSTHETTRCRYRPVMTGQGSPPVDEDSMMGGIPGA